MNDFAILEQKKDSDKSKLEWETPELIKETIADITLGNGGGGFDFASEVSA
jgi:hypothetical protein